MSSFKQKKDSGENPFAPASPAQAPPAPAEPAPAPPPLHSAAHAPPAQNHDLFNIWKEGGVERQTGDPPDDPDHRPTITIDGEGPHRVG